MNRKDREVLHYQKGNEKRLLALSGREILDELCDLRSAAKEARWDHDRAKEKLKESEAYTLEQGAKEDLFQAEVAVEATLRMIESRQGRMPLVATDEETAFDGRGVQQQLDDIRDLMKAENVTGVSLSFDGRTVELGRCEDGPESVNTVTGEVVPAPEAMQQRVFGPYDAAGQSEVTVH